MIWKGVGMRLFFVFLGSGKSLPKKRIQAARNRETADRGEEVASKDPGTKSYLYYCGVFQFDVTKVSVHVRHPSAKPPQQARWGY